MAIFLSIIEADIKDTLVLLKRVLYIYYPLYFQKKFINVKALINNKSKINIIIPVYVARLDLKISPTNVGAQKTDNSIIQTFGMVIVSFWIDNKLRRPRFFQKTFLVIKTSMEVILRIFFLGFSNRNI